MSLHEGSCQPLCPGVDSCPGLEAADGLAPLALLVLGLWVSGGSEGIFPPLLCPPSAHSPPTSILLLHGPWGHVRDVQNGVISLLLHCGCLCPHTWQRGELQVSCSPHTRAFEQHLVGTFPATFPHLFVVQLSTLQPFPALLLTCNCTASHLHRPTPAPPHTCVAAHLPCSSPAASYTSSALHLQCPTPALPHTCPASHLQRPTPPAPYT